MIKDQHEAEKKKVESQEIQVRDLTCDIHLCIIFSSLYFLLLINLIHLHIPQFEVYNTDAVK